MTKDSGFDIIHTLDKFTGSPETGSFFAGAFLMRHGQKICIKFAVVIGKIIAGDQHVCHLHSINVHRNVFIITQKMSDYN